MDDSVSDKFDIDTTEEIPVMRVCGGGKREKTCKIQSNKILVKDSPVNLVQPLPIHVNEPAKDSEPNSKIRPTNELIKGPCIGGSESICESNNESIKEPISEPVSETINEVSVSNEYELT